MSKEKTVVAQAVAALTVEQQSIAENCGRRFSRSQNDNIENAKAYARMIGTEPTFEQWENGRIKWVDGYLADNKDNTANAADKAWERYAEVLSTLFGLKKPTSKSAAATKKREERAAKTTALLEQHKDTTPDELRQKIEHAYKALVKDPTNKVADKAVKDFKKVLAAKTSEENKARMEELVALRTQIREAAKKCSSHSTLQAALDILAGDADFEYASDEDFNWAQHEEDEALKRL